MPSDRGVRNVSTRQSAHTRRTSRCATTPTRVDDEHERIDAQLEQTRDRGGRVVGVQRRQHEVPRERGLGGDRCRLTVADLTHHDDVRILAQHVAQRLREGEPDLRLHRDLVEESITISIGSSIVTTLISGDATARSVA